LLPVCGTSTWHRLMCLRLTHQMRIARRGDNVKRKRLLSLVNTCGTSASYRMVFFFSLFCVSSFYWWQFSHISISYVQHIVGLLATVVNNHSFIRRNKRERQG
jgi:hypothetical protein